MVLLPYGAHTLHRPLELPPISPFQILGSLRFFSLPSYRPEGTYMW